MAEDTQLGMRGAKSAFLGSSGQVLKLGINMVSLVLLSRILSPEDYGLTALALALIGVAELVRDMGLSTASIQAKTLSKAEQGNLWWANSLLGLSCTLIVSALAPLIAFFYKDSRLTAIIILMSLVFTFSGMATQYRVDLIRKLQYGRLASWEIFASALGLIAAIIIAFSGGGYWALVAQQVVNNLLLLLGFAFLAGWLPKKYDRSVSIKSFFTFAFPLFGSSVLTYIAGNLDTALIGKYFGNTTLGSYNRALQMIRMPMNQIRNPLGNVALTVLGQSQDDSQHYKSLILKAQGLFLYPIVLLAVWVALLAPDFIAILLGSKWADSLVLVRIIALGEAVSSLSTAAGWVYLSKAKSGALFRLTIYSTLLRILLLFAAVPFGINAVAAVFLLVATILWPATFIHCKLTTGFNTMPMFLVSLRTFISVAFAALSTYLLTSLINLDNHLFSLALGSVTFGLFFLLAALAIKPVRQDLDYLVRTIKRLVKS